MEAQLRSFPSDMFGSILMKGMDSDVITDCGVRVRQSHRWRLGGAGRSLSRAVGVRGSGAVARNQPNERRGVQLRVVQVADGDGNPRTVECGSNLLLSAGRHPHLTAVAYIIGPEEVVLLSGLEYDLRPIQF
jgi:hypothetical protein